MFSEDNQPHFISLCNGFVAQSNSGFLAEINLLAFHAPRSIKGIDYSYRALCLLFKDLKIRLREFSMVPSDRRLDRLMDIQGTIDFSPFVFFLFLLVSVKLSLLVYLLSDDALRHEPIQLFDG